VANLLTARLSAAGRHPRGPDESRGDGRPERDWHRLCDVARERTDALKGETITTRRFSGGLSCGAVLLTLLVAANVFAGDTVVVTSSPSTSPIAPAEPAPTLPNRFLLRSGIFTLGAAYVPVLVVASESDRAADNHLYAPIVGPWFDLAARNDCAGACSGETVNEVLLVTDGVFQGLGALQILGAFVMPETRTVALHKADGSPAVAFSVMPASFGRGANGLMGWAISELSF
jgi:hypothetical protein